mmetsp:Transcript_329/g.469  ORF Transcript_329/g.469 Transcript_329/m.469 type:complete len:228 (-) Transcript_329:28-711(-)
MADKLDGEDEMLPPTSERGVVYMSRVPPRMGPRKVKQMLSGFGEVTRIFLQEEDASLTRRRQKAGKHGKRYVEGWIEFADKKLAKRVAKSLNATAMGKVKKGGGTDFYAYDLWNLKYLKGFTWEHLREKVAYERRVQSHKLKMRVARAKQTNDEYVQMADDAKTFAAIEARKQRKNQPSSSSLQQNVDEDHRDFTLLSNFVGKRQHAQTKTVTPKFDDNLDTLLGDL